MVHDGSSLPSGTQAFLMATCTDDFMLCGKYLRPLPPLSGEGKKQFLDEYRSACVALALANERLPDYWYLSMACQHVEKSRFYCLLEQLWRLKSYLESSAGDRGEPLYLLLPDSRAAAPVHAMGTILGFDVVAGDLGSGGGQPPNFRTKLRRGLSKFRYLANLCGWKLFGNRRLEHGQVLIASVTTEQTLACEPYRDVLFGALPLRLAEAGLKPILFLHCLGRKTGIAADDLPEALKGWVTGYRDQTTIWDALRAVLQAAGMPVAVPPLFACGGVDISVFAWMDVEEARFGELSDVLLQQRALQRLFEGSPDAVILHPWENHGWEHSCRLAGGKIRAVTIGYQHSAVLESHLKMQAFVGKDCRKPGPDFLLTTGEFFRDLLVSSFGHDAERILPGCALRKSPRPNSERMVRERDQPSVLVLLQGGAGQEAFHEFLARAFRDLKGWRVTLRPHPALSLERTLAGSALALGGGIAESQNISLAQDLLCHDAVIYNGSTAVFEAVESGIPVLHLSTGNTLSNDPLQEMDCKKAATAEPEEVIWILDHLRTEHSDGRKQAGLDMELVFSTPEEQKLNMIVDWISQIAGNGMNAPEHKISR